MRPRSPSRRLRNRRHRASSPGPPWHWRPPGMRVETANRGANASPPDAAPSSCRAWTCSGLVCWLDKLSRDSTGGSDMAPADESQVHEASRCQRLSPHPSVYLARLPACVFGWAQTIPRQHPLMQPSQLFDNDGLHNFSLSLRYMGINRLHNDRQRILFWPHHH